MKEPCKKIKYGTKEIAEEDLRRIRKTSKKEILPVSVYKCPQCNSWHLTSKPYDTEELRNKHESEKEDIKRYVCDALIVCHSMRQQLTSMQGKIDKIMTQLKDAKCHL